VSLFVNANGHEVKRLRYIGAKAGEISLEMLDGN
jgi:hypothetical protein